MIGLNELNELPSTQFVIALAGIFEHSPWVAERAAPLRPFGSRLQLLDAMRTVVETAPVHEQLALIRAHPYLGVRSRPKVLTEASAREQRRAGLDACSPEEALRLQQLNGAYAAKFGFPFIIAVRGHDPASIIAHCERRLSNDASLEQRTALREIGLIAGYRLADVVASTAGAESAAMMLRLAQPSGADGTALVREWMQAAALEVWVAADGLCGYRGCNRPHSRILLSAVYYDASAKLVRYDGRAAFVTAIAVAHQLKQKHIELSFAWAIMARPDDERTGASTIPAVGAALYENAGPALAGEAGSDELLAALRAGPAPAGSMFVLAQRAGTERDANSSSATALTEPSAEHVARALEYFLLQTT